MHTGQNYDYELNEIFFRELGIRRRITFSRAAGRDGRRDDRQGDRQGRRGPRSANGPTPCCIYGDTNSCLAAIAAKRRRIPVFHMEAGNRCFDERVPEEINRRIVDHISDINMPLHRARAPVPARRRAAARDGDQDRLADARGARVLPARHRALRRAGAARSSRPGGISSSARTARRTSTIQRRLRELLDALDRARHAGTAAGSSCRPTRARASG